MTETFSASAASKDPGVLRIAVQVKPLTLKYVLRTVISCSIVTVRSGRNKRNSVLRFGMDLLCSR